MAWGHGLSDWGGLVVPCRRGTGLQQGCKDWHGC